jgi:iron complex transport system substrate-binding protein
MIRTPRSTRRLGAASTQVLFVIVAVLSLTAVLAAFSLRTPGDGSLLDDAENSTGGPRVVALLPFAADQLIALGHAPVAVPELRGETPEPWSGIPTVAMDHSAGPNIEQIIAARPDVVITSSVYAQFVPGIETQTGADVMIMDIDRAEDVVASLRTLGELTRATDRADEIIASLPGDASGEPGDGGPSVLPIFGTPHAFYTFLPDSYLGDLIQRAGGTLLTEEFESHSVYRGLAPITMELVIERDPDLILVIFHGPEETARQMLQRDPLWGSLTAVREGNVVFLQDDLYAMRPGSELGRALSGIRDAVNGISAGGEG